MAKEIKKQELMEETFEEEMEEMEAETGEEADVEAKPKKKKLKKILIGAGLALIGFAVGAGVGHYSKKGNSETGTDDEDAGDESSIEMTEF